MLAFGREYGLEKRDLLFKEAQFFFEFAHFEFCKAFQAHIENGLRLRVRKVEPRAQSFFGFLRGLRLLDDFYHFVDVAYCNQQTAHYLRASLCRFQIVSRAVDDYFALIFDVIVEICRKAQLLGLAVCDRNHIHGIAHFEIGLFEKECNDFVDVAVALAFDDGARARLVRLVNDFGYAGKRFLVGLLKLRNARKQLRLGHLIRYLRDYDVFLAVVVVFNVQTRADFYPAFARRIYIFQFVNGDNKRACREVGTVENFEKVVHGAIGIVYSHYDGVDALPHIVRGDVGGKSDGYAVCAVDEKIGKSAGERVGFFETVVEVWRPHDRFFVKVAQKFERKRTHSRFRITHCRRPVAVHRAEVAVSVNKLHSHRERLRHTHHRSVHRTVAVRMIFSEAVAHYSSAFFVRFVRSEPHLVH